MAHIGREFAFGLVAEFRGARALAFEFDMITLLRERQLHCVQGELAVQYGRETDETKNERGYGANAPSPR